MRIIHLSDIQEGCYGMKSNIEDLCVSQIIKQNKSKLLTIKKKINNDKIEFRDIITNSKDLANSGIDENLYTEITSYHKEYLKNFKAMYLYELGLLKSKLHEIQSKKPIDILLITGDFVSTGSESEFETLKKEFIPILEYAFLKNENCLPKKSWLFCPGNHDLKWITNKEDLKEKNERFNNYLNFCKDLKILNSDLPINDPSQLISNCKIIDKKTNLEINFISLNSCMEIFDKTSNRNSSLNQKYFLQIEDYFLDKNPKIIITHHRLNDLSRESNNALKELHNKNVILALSGDFHETSKDYGKDNSGIFFFYVGSLFGSKEERTLNLDEIPRQFCIYDIDFEYKTFHIEDYSKGRSWGDSNKIGIKFSDEFWDQFHLIKTPLSSISSDNTIIQNNISKIPFKNIYFEHYLLRAQNWQDRPELEKVCKWWQSYDSKVCALIGIGGSGKTAIIDHFLQLLPNVLPSLPKIKKRTDLKSPNYLFVYSFYYESNSSIFFVKFCKWLEIITGEIFSIEEIQKNKSYDDYQNQYIQHSLKSINNCLIVLDGLERVQYDGAQNNAFGALMDYRLRDFIFNIANGNYLKNILLLISSRFPLYDCDSLCKEYYTLINIDKLSLSSSIALLKARGVHDVDEKKLEEIAIKYNCHALTIDLIGGYISIFLNGIPQKILEYEKLEIPSENEKLDGNVNRLKILEKRLGNVMNFYHKTLKTVDNLALILFQRICLFRSCVNEQLLKDIFSNKKIISNEFLQEISITPYIIHNKLMRLKLMGIIECHIDNNDPNQTIEYTAHPAIKMGFIQTLTKDIIISDHSNIKEGLEISLNRYPDSKSKPSDPLVLDILEELIYHTYKIGKINEAFNIFDERMGGYENLGKNIFDFQRIERICRIFNNNNLPSLHGISINISWYNICKFLGIWEDSLFILGDIKNAKLIHQEYMKNSPIEQNICRESITLANILLTEGNLNSAITILTDCINKAQNYKSELKGCYLSLSFLYLLQGNSQYQKFGQECLKIDSEMYYSINFCFMLKFLIDFNEIFKINDIDEMFNSLRKEFDNRQEIKETDKFIMGLIEYKNKNLEKTKEYLQDFKKWAIIHRLLQEICICILIETEIYITQKDLIEDALTLVEEGLLIARKCGFSLIHIDLMINKAKLLLLKNDTAHAEECVKIALFGCISSPDQTKPYYAPILDNNSDLNIRGIFPPLNSCLPNLLSATNPECNYRLGEIRAKKILIDIQLSKKILPLELLLEFSNMNYYRDINNLPKKNHN